MNRARLVRPPRLAVAVLACLGATQARGQEQTFSPQHVAKVRFVTAAEVSPDGKQVAYVLSVPRDLPREKDGPAWAELHVVDAAGRSRPFLTGEVNLDSVAWRPDGKAISFLTKRGKDTLRALYVIPADGGEARKVVSHGADIESYS